MNTITIHFDNAREAFAEGEENIFENLPRKSLSRFLESRSILKNIQDLKIQELTERNVVHHPLVQKVIQAYTGKAEQHVIR